MVNTYNLRPESTVGKTELTLNFSFRIAETDAEIEARINKWEKHLDNEDDEKKVKSEAAK